MPLARIRYNTSAAVVGAILLPIPVVFLLTGWMMISARWNEGVIIVSCTALYIAALLAALRFVQVPVRVALSPDGIWIQPLRGFQPYRHLDSLLAWSQISSLYLVQRPRQRDASDLALAIQRGRTLGYLTAPAAILESVLADARRQLEPSGRGALVQSGVVTPAQEKAQSRFYQWSVAISTVLFLLVLVLRLLEAFGLI
jgi:hypothetical protein